MRHHERPDAARGARDGAPKPHQFSGPLYEQVRGLILSRIESGDWRAGSPIPAEVQLSRDFGVSIGTVRKALDQLARDRILVRERGRGTFVKDGVMDGAIRRGGLGLRLCDANGVPVQATISLIAAEYAVANAEEIVALRMLRPSLIVPRALKMRREWRSGGELLCLETIIVDAARFPNLQFEADPEADVFFRVYASKYQSPVDRIAWTMKPLTSGDPIAKALRDGRDVTIMRCVRSAFDAKDLPLEICEQIVILGGGFALSASQ